MPFLIRGLLWFVVLVGVTTCTFTVKVGDRTTAQHIRRIWSAPETQDLVKGVEDTAGPTFQRIKRGVEAGVREAGVDEAAREAAEAAGDQAGELERRASDAAREAAKDAARRELEREVERVKQGGARPE